MAGRLYEHSLKRMHLLIVFTSIACFVRLHEARGILPSFGHRRLTLDNPLICQDQDVCTSSPDLCTTGDFDIVKVLCPVTCGGCVCEDDPLVRGTCSSLVPDICWGDLGPTLCAKSCEFCKGQDSPTTLPNPTVVTTPSDTEATTSNCEDVLVGLSCTDLPNPCDDELGKNVCQKFCNLCPGEVTAAATTKSTTKATTDDTTNATKRATTEATTEATTDATTETTTEATSEATTDATTETTTDVTTKVSTKATTEATTESTTEASTDATTKATTATTLSTTTTAPATTSAQIQSSVCANNPCLNGGICQPTSADAYTCFCPSTYTGVICHIAASLTTATTTTTSTTQPTTQTTQGVTSASNETCPDIKTTKTSLGCVPAEIVFMIEYSVSDLNWFSVNHEGGFIKALVDKWTLDDRHIRVGVIVYHNTVTESIHLGDYSSKQNLKDKISSLTRSLRPSGNADLGRAIDYARQTSFVGSRPGVERILVPLIHQTGYPEKQRIVPAAERLKKECIALLGIAVQGTLLDVDVVQAAVSTPISDYYQFYNSYNQVEEDAKNHFSPDCYRI